MIYPLSFGEILLILIFKRNEDQSQEFIQKRTRLFVNLHEIIRFMNNPYSDGSRGMRNEKWKPLENAKGGG